MATKETKAIVVGSRKSELALIQTRHVIAKLKKIWPKERFAPIHTMTTMGDRVLNISLPKIGEKALFTKDLEDALASGHVDFVVHSLKDLPTVLPAGMAIGAILEREDPRDALVLRPDVPAEHRSLVTLPAGSVIGTSSLRRGAQLARKYPHLRVEDIRGNLNTRLAKLNADGSKFAGIILAQAGLERMGWHDRIKQTLEADDILYAVGQGALAVECRANDARILGLLQQLCCVRTQCRILTERSFLRTLGGGCSAPVAVVTELQGADAGGGEDGEEGEHELLITGAVWSLDGSVEVQSRLKCKLDLSGKRTRQTDSGVHDVEDVSSSSSNSSSNSLDAATPAKRARLDDSNESSSSADSKKSASPTIVDDTPVPSVADMSQLLRLHGDLLRKCPYAATHHAEKASAEGNQSRCPLNVVSGQDVMGACPYLQAEQQALKLEAEATAATATVAKVATDVMGKCPFSAAQREEYVAAAAANGAGGDGGAANATQVAAAAAGCPYAGKKASGSGADEMDNVQPKPELLEPKASGSGCPFLKSTAAVSVESEKAIGSGPNGDNVAEVPLFCGLFRHECYELEWFERCERLGAQLAEALIAQGAMKVMEGAQLEIRKGI